MKLNRIRHKKLVRVSVTPVSGENTRKTPYEFTLTVPVENFFWHSVSSYEHGSFESARIKANELITQPKRSPRSPIFTSKIIKF